MTRKIHSRLYLILSAICFLAAFLIMCSCNPVKRVLSNPKLTDKVVAEWRKDNPYDTAKTVVPGKDTVIIRETVKYDSIPLPYPVNHRYTEIRYKDRLVTDTVYIRDTAMIGVLLRKIEAQEVVINELRADIKSLRGFKAGVIFLAVLAFVIAGVSLAKKFKLFGL